MLGGEIFCFTDVVFEVVELGAGGGGFASEFAGSRAAARSFNEFPVARAQGELLAKTPKERLMRDTHFLTREIRQQVYAVQMPGWFGLDTRSGQGGGQDIELYDRAVVHFTSRDMALPLHNPGDANAAFPCL